MSAYVSVVGGYGSAGAGNRTGRRITTRSGVSTTASERNRRVEKAARDVKLTDDPPKDELLRYLEAGKCWWCDDGRVFKSPVQHLRVHDISVQWVRDYLVLPKTHSFNCEETKQLKSSIAKKNYNPEKLVSPTGAKVKHKSTAWMESQRKKLKKHKEEIGKDAVRRQLKEASRRSKEIQTQKAKEKRRRNPAYCVICGKEAEWLMGKAKPKTCSDGCLQRLRLENTEEWRTRGVSPRNCINCGKEFVPPNSSRATCSDECASERISKKAKEDAAWKVPLAIEAMKKKRENTPKKLCSVEGCDKIHRCKGFCNKHYREYLATLPDRECDLGGCNNPIVAKGLCSKHYDEARKREQARG